MAWTVATLIGAVQRIIRTLWAVIPEVQAAERASSLHIGDHLQEIRADGTDNGTLRAPKCANDCMTRTNGSAITPSVVAESASGCPAIARR